MPRIWDFFRGKGENNLELFYGWDGISFCQFSNVDKYAEEHFAHLAQKFNTGFFLQPFNIVLIQTTIINVRDHL